MQMRLDQIVSLVGGEILGDGGTLISGVAGIDDAEQGDITFLSNPQYRRYLKSTKASALILPSTSSSPIESIGDSPHKDEDSISIPVILSENPYYCFAQVMRLFHTQEDEYPKEIHLTAQVAKTAQIGAGIYIGPHVCVEEGAKIEDGVRICANSIIGKNCKIGQGTLIYPNVTIYKEIQIGKDVIIHSGAVIGSDGFGFAPDNGKYHKVPQVGTVIIEDDAEIGANTTIDRATMGVTRIGKGTKIDNLVQIAHNVEIAADTVIAAQAGVSGSTKIGRKCQIGGQVGFVGHIELGDESIVGAQSGIAKSFPEKSFITGSPARSIEIVRKTEAYQSKIPDLLKRVKQLEKQMEELKEELRDG